MMKGPMLRKALIALQKSWSLKKITPCYGLRNYLRNLLLWKTKLVRKWKINKDNNLIQSCKPLSLERLKQPLKNFYLIRIITVTSFPVCLKIPMYWKVMNLTSCTSTCLMRYHRHWSSPKFYSLRRSNLSLLDPFQLWTWSVHSLRRMKLEANHLIWF
jgi:hypothetical protein